MKLTWITVLFALMAVAKCEEKKEAAESSKDEDQQAEETGGSSAYVPDSSNFGARKSTTPVSYTSSQEYAEPTQQRQTQYPSSYDVSYRPSSKKSRPTGQYAQVGYPSPVSQPAPLSYPKQDPYAQAKYPTQSYPTAGHSISGSPNYGYAQPPQAVKSQPLVSSYYSNSGPSSYIPQEKAYAPRQPESAISGYPVESYSKKPALVSSYQPAKTQGRAPVYDLGDISGLTEEISKINAQLESQLGHPVVSQKGGEYQSAPKGYTYPQPATSTKGHDSYLPASKGLEYQLDPKSLDVQIDPKGYGYQPVGVKEYSYQPAPKGSSYAAPVKSYAQIPASKPQSYQPLSKGYDVYQPPSKSYSYQPAAPSKTYDYQPESKSYDYQPASKGYDYQPVQGQVQSYQPDLKTYDSYSTAPKTYDSYSTVPKSYDSYSTVPKNYDSYQQPSKSYDYQPAPKSYDYQPAPKSYDYQPAPKSYDYQPAPKTYDYQPAPKSYPQYQPVSKGYTSLPPSSKSSYIQPSIYSKPQVSSGHYDSKVPASYDYGVQQSYASQPADLTSVTKDSYAPSGAYTYAPGSGSYHTRPASLPTSKKSY